MAKKKKLSAKPVATIGVFYQRSSDPNDVVYTTGGQLDTLYGYNARMKAFSAKAFQVLTWKRLNVNDFPNSPDPRLPAVFDLHWDVKHISQLQYASRDERIEIEVYLKEHFGRSASIDQLEELTRIVRAYNDTANGYVNNLPR